MRRSRFFAFALVPLLAAPRIAEACGGCFSPPPPTPERAQVVTDHRMVFSLSQRQTTLWDQIQYAGDPENFVWVLPVADASTLRIGLADNEFVEALDQYTAPTVTASLPVCFPARDASRGLVTGCGSQGNIGLGALPGSDSTHIARDGEATVGPYEIAVIGSSMGGGRLDDWLAARGFMVPRPTQAAIDYYEDLEFDFVILRLAPGVGVHQMQPVRITTRGYAPVLPLRMIAAGVGEKVGLSLMVIANTRMDAQGFTNAVIRDEDLEFTYGQNTSNWRTLYASTIARSMGQVWLIESAQNLYESELTYGGGPLAPYDGGLRDGGMDARGDVLDSSIQWVGDAAMPEPDGGMVFETDAAVTSFDGGPMFPPMMADASTYPPPEAYVDRRYAFTGLGGRAVITRMRTDLRLQDLNRDLILESSPDGLIPATYIAGKLLNAPSCPTGRSCSVIGTTAPAFMEATAVALLIMRLRRRRKNRAERSETE